MSQALTLARPYARAAFAVARNEGSFAQWSAALGFSAQLAAHPTVSALLLNPNLRQAQITQLVDVEAAQKPPATYSQFLSLLAHAKRVALLPEISAMFEQLRADAESVVKAKVTSASVLSSSELETIRTALKRRFGTEVTLETAIDESLIGGAIIDAGDVVIDGSLKGKLSRLKTALAD